MKIGHVVKLSSGQQLWGPGGEKGKAFKEQYGEPVLFVGVNGNLKPGAIIALLTVILKDGRREEVPSDLLFPNRTL